MSKNSESWDLIAKYLADTLSNSESEQFQSWLKESEDNKLILDKARIMWKLSSSAKKETKPDTQQQWDELLPKLIEQDQSPELKKYNLGNLSPLKVAAGILILVGLTFILVTNPFSDNTVEDTIVHNETISTNDTPKSFFLPDSSMVVLNQNSVLNFDSNFGSKDRTVVLNGEAYFEVKHNSSKPFRIIGNSTITTVIGTSFYLKTSESENLETVDVFEGEVDFSSSKDPETSVRVKKGEKGEFEKSNASIKKDKSSREKPDWLERIEDGTENLFDNIKTEIKKL